ncbi:MAG: rod shape-determining protein MreC [Micavibrio aeruginosavorus]|uniref:Cell shape-determining protein MreC n=1 Tax=Micavibrio aeruginosavorus TaxID=349221 RepID=A0A7T5R208_9BACT|nr:MAG: rod shape-determining protein MreC [Micavibrio aeruginosavorus]
MQIRSRPRSLIRIATLQAWGPRATSLFFAVAALILFTMSFASPNNMRSLRTTAADIFAPVLAVVNYPIEQAASYVRAVTGIAELQRENTRLMQENARLREWYHAALQLKSDNESLQKLLKVQIEPQHTFITARIIADSDTAFVRSVLVMAGSDQGVDAAQAVLGGEGLLGRIVETGKRSSHVLLVTDMNARVPVFVGAGNMRAMLAGNNTDRPELIHLPPQAQVKAGDRVVTSGHGGLYPHGLPVGEVAAASDGALNVRLYADIDRTTYVRIVKRTDDPNLRIAPVAAPEAD